MRKPVLLWLVCVLLFVQLAVAQTKTVTGKVTEASGTPVANATISVNGRSVGIAGTGGNFSVAVPAAVNAITITATGFIDRTITLTGGALTVVLTPGESASLSEVVVTGYTTVRRRNFTGATANVSPAKVREQTFGSFDQALQGNAAGVSVLANSGQPGANAVVRIRGNGSITGGNVPLYIMDGIEISAADFATINQGDFERIEVLKDAVATSIYGSRGANGVIVITTRRGRAGQLQLNYEAQVGISELPKDRLVLMDSRQKIDYELQRGNPYGWTATEADSLRNVNFNWKDALFERGVTHQHIVSASGGSQTSRFFASLSYFDQEGVVKTTGLKRYTARINVDNTIKNWRFGANLQAGFSNRVNTSEANTFLSSPLNAIRWSNPYERDIDPRTGDYQETGGPNTGQLTSGQPNAAMELFLNNNSTLQVKGIGTAYLEYHFPFLKGLYARTNWGIDYTQNEGSAFTSPRTSTGIARQGNLTRSMNRNLRYTGTTSLNYRTTIADKHEVEASVFAEVVKNDFRSFGFTGYGLNNGFSNETGITPGSATNPNYIPVVSGNGQQNGLQSFFALVNYGYNSKYYINLVGRRDGSSRFGVNNRYANFGSVGATWLVSDEDFLKNVSAISLLKVRASIGTNGNNGGGDVPNYPQALFGSISYGGRSGWSVSSPGNPDLRWETNRSINAGIDFAFFKNRLTGTVEAYDRLTTDLFYGIPVDPSLSGFTSILGNLGKLRNRGVEFTLQGDVLRSKNFYWTLGGNITYNQNRIVDLLRDSVITGNTILAEGKPLNSYYLVESAGVDPANGNALYYTRSKATTAAFSVNDKVILGTADAPWYGGITTAVGFKGLELSAQVAFFLDRYLYNNDRNNVTNPTYYFDNMSTDVLREWKNPGDVTDVPRPSSGTLGGTAPANPYQVQTTRFLEDASYWRLRNVMLSYTFNQAVLSKLKIRAARIFVQGQNLLTATRYKSFDPEATGTSLVGAQYPALIQGTVGLNIGF